MTTPKGPLPCLIFSIFHAACSIVCTHVMPQRTSARSHCTSICPQCVLVWPQRTCVRPQGAYATPQHDCVFHCKTSVGNEKPRVEKTCCTTTACVCPLPPPRAPCPPGDGPMKSGNPSGFVLLLLWLLPCYTKQNVFILFFAYCVIFNKSVNPTGFVVFFYGCYRANTKQLLFACFSHTVFFRKACCVCCCFFYS